MGVKEDRVVPSLDEGSLTLLSFNEGTKDIRERPNMYFKNVALGRGTIMVGSVLGTIMILVDLTLGIEEY